jgi:hypothetical protein
LEIVYPSNTNTKIEILRGMECRAHSRWDTLEQAEIKEDSLEGRAELDNLRATRMQVVQKIDASNSMLRNNPWMENNNQQSLIPRKL